MKNFLFVCLQACARGLARAARATFAGARAVGRGSLVVARSRVVVATEAVMLALVRIALVAGIVTLFALGGGWLCFQRVPPGMIGVKQANFGGGGLDARDYTTGLHFGVRGLVDWHLVHRGTQVVTFAWESEGGDHPMLAVRTRDGNVASVGVSVPYRVKPGEAHALVRDGLKNAYRTRVKSTVEKVLLQELAALSSEEFALTDVRLARCASALPKLNELLAEYHVEAESILVSQVMFGISYEKKLQEKQLTRQTTLVAEAQTQVDAQREQNELEQARIDGAEKQIRADMDEKIATQLAAGRRTIIELESQAKEYDRTRRAEATAERDRLTAEGERELARAEAVKDELEVALYASNAGKLMLATKAVANLNIKSVTLNSNDPRVPNLLDLDQFVKLMLGGLEVAAREPARGD